MGVMISSGNSHCFTADAVFKISPAFFQTAHSLQRGSEVLAADETTTLEVTKVVLHKAKNVTYLEAGEAKLTVSGNHRMMVPNGEVRAAELNIGDEVMCRVSSGEIMPQALTDVLVLVDDEADPEVLEATFRPDLPVAVFQHPTSTMLCKGSKMKRIRRGLRKSCRNSIPDTLYDFSD